MTTTSKMNLSVCASPKFIIEEVVYEARITMPTLTKLLPMSMVANNNSGFCRWLKTMLLVLPPSSFSSAISLGRNEKKATSEPDIRALKISKTNVVIIAITAPVVIGKKVKSCSSIAADELKNIVPINDVII